MDLRRARGERNRQALVTCAIRLFETNGYESTTVEQISAAAGVATRTFFHHFAAKEDLLFDGYAERLEEAAQRFRSSRSSSLWGALAEASAAVAQTISAEPDFFLVRARMYAGSPGLRATLLRLNDDWIDQMTHEVAARLGADEPLDMRPRLAASAINAANRTAIDTWVASAGHLDLIDTVAQAVALLRPSINRIERLVKEEHGCGVG